MKLCSIACINKHKIDHECIGKADLVAYVDKRNSWKRFWVCKEYVGIQIG